MRVKGELVREARVKKRFSQEDLAHFLNISQSQYSKLENGEADFDISKLGLLLDKLDLNPLEIIEFSEKQQVFYQLCNVWKSQ
jgi:transcriptional regulator with XRE-family HTH domain